MMIILLQNIDLIFIRIQSIKLSLKNFFTEESFKKKEKGRSWKKGTKIFDSGTDNITNFSFLDEVFGNMIFLLLRKFSIEVLENTKL